MSRRKPLLPNPTTNEFETHLQKMKRRQKYLEEEYSNSFYVVGSQNLLDTKKREMFFQETLKRDQYLLSTRQNRHIVHAAKLAKSKNAGLTNILNKNVKLWVRECQNSIRQAQRYENRLSRDLECLRKRKNDLRELALKPRVDAMIKKQNSFSFNVAISDIRQVTSSLESLSLRENDLQSETNSVKESIRIDSPLRLPPLNSRRITNTTTLNLTEINSND